MSRNKNRVYMRMWELFYPLLMYFSISIFLMYLLQMFLGSDTKHYPICKIVSSLVVIPVLYFSFYKPDCKLWNALCSPTLISERMRQDVWIVLLAVCIGIGLNNVIAMSILMKMSNSYQEATSYFYGSTLVVELISSALLTPIAEELIYRGILFGRLKRMFSPRIAVFLSALLFGLIHFNLVQFVYAFLFGIVLAIVMEDTGRLGGAILLHATANAIAVLRTELGILASTVDRSVAAWSVSVLILFIGIGMLWMYTKRKNIH